MMLCYETIPFDRSSIAKDVTARKLTCSYGHCFQEQGMLHLLLTVITLHTVPIGAKICNFNFAHNELYSFANHHSKRHLHNDGVLCGFVTMPFLRDFPRLSDTNVRMSPSCMLD